MMYQYCVNGTIQFQYQGEWYEQSIIEATCAESAANAKDNILNEYIRTYGITARWYTLELVCAAVI